MSLAAPPVIYEQSDLAALLRRDRPRLLRPLLWICAILTLVAAAIMVLVPMAVTPTTRLLAMVAIALLALIGLLLWLAPRLGMAAARRDGTNIAQHFAIQADGFRAESARAVTVTRWSAVRRVERDADRLFVYVAPRRAFIVPRRVFDSDAAFVAFADAAAQHQAAAQ